MLFSFSPDRDFTVVFRPEILEIVGSILIFNYMPLTLPTTGKPRLSSAQILQRFKRLRDFKLSDHPLVIAGVRGYYKDSMGAPGVNDRGIYDDAIFVYTPSVMASYNGNTDPSFYRKGFGSAEKTKGMASLNPGVWNVYQFDLHRGKYLALCQKFGPVTVTRDGVTDYIDVGYFGINIHKGGRNTTSSLGCQTIHPDQWESFISLVTDQAKRYFGLKWKKTCIPYVLFAD
jgi:lysozyme